MLSATSPRINRRHLPLVNSLCSDTGIIIFSILHFLGRAVLMVFELGVFKEIHVFGLFKDCKIKKLIN
jgi:hypothetical protein